LCSCTLDLRTKSSFERVINWKIVFLCNAACNICNWAFYIALFWSLCNVLILIHIIQLKNLHHLYLVSSNLLFIFKNPSNFEFTSYVGSLRVIFKII
jgi:hypothetical protein